MYRRMYSRESVRLLTVALILSISALCFAQFGGGNGTADSPYQIGTAAHLNAIRGQFLNQNLHFVQTANIDLDQAPWNEEGGWVPIGDSNVRFQGNFNGAEFTVRGLTINRNQQYQGLFGNTSGATLLNISLVDVDIVSSGQFTGTLVGRADNTRIDKCVAEGTLNSEVQGVAYIGGLLGYYSGQMSNCIANVNVTVRNGDRIGGLIGDSWGNVRDTYATGNVIGNNRVGGLCGDDYNGIHERVLATGDVSGNNEVGGLYGFVQTARYNDCYATGNVTGNSQVGGLIGNYNLPANVNQQLHRGYSIGIVTGENQTGGLIGRIQANMPGPFNSYWNTETSEQNESAGGEGLTIMEMLERESFENWDFTDNGPWRMDPGAFPYLAMEGDQAGEHNFPTEFLPPRNFRYVIGDDRDEINFFWNEPPIIEPIGYNLYRDGERLNDEILEGEEYSDTDVEEWVLYTYSITALYVVEEEVEESTPAQLRVIITNFEEGDGSVDNPYTVSTVAQLAQIRNLRQSHFIQTANIDLTDEEWQPLGSQGTPFTGGFNGNEFAVSNLTIDSDRNYQGLFGFTAGAVLNNIFLNNVDITGGDFVGALAGRSDNTTVVDCSAEGTVNGISNVGGLIGFAGGIMQNCHTNVQVEGTGNQIGGLIGDSRGMVERCYTLGDVTGIDFVGGLVGFDADAGIAFSFAMGNVTGGDQVGGLIGMLRNSRMQSSYATGNVQGRENVGGLIGTNSSRFHYSYSLGRVTGQNNVGGLVGMQDPNAVADRSYWNTRTSGQENSAGGEARDERHMTYPYSDDTFVEWDFQRTWVADQDYDNRGYPYLEWQPLFSLPYPDAATTPAPANMTGGVSVNLQELRWNYTQTGAFTNPVGFRVYFNATGEFGDDDDFEWVAFDEDEETFVCSSILPEQLGYLATYHWKVVPTTVDPEDERAGNRERRTKSSDDRTSLQSPWSLERGDAQDVPVWRFTTEIHPNPVVAVNPQPQDEATDIPVSINQLGWTFNTNPDHRNPVGFRVYLNTSGEFSDDDDFVWVRYVGNQTNYNNSTALPEVIEYAQTYYWKVVPTTNFPEERRLETRRRSRDSWGRTQLNPYETARNDAENVPVWTFSTITSEPYPLPATNPDPEHLATGVSNYLSSVSWDYITSEVNAEPVGFRVYMNMTGAFGQNAPYVWVDYIAQQRRYSSSEVVPEYLDANTTYYWRVVPTVNHPDGRQGRSREYSERQEHNSILRGDAQDSPVWRFTTGTSQASEEPYSPVVTELKANYPNPFNPETTISFSLAERGRVSLEIYNIRGQKVVTLYDAYKKAGNHQIIWNGRDSDNQQAGSGTYLLRMMTESYTETVKMVLMK